MNAYWAQWSIPDLASMQDVEDIDYREDKCDDSPDNKEDVEEEHSCSGSCIDCLGLSWRDFF